jgi:hypothetical protein
VCSAKPSAFGFSVVVVVVVVEGGEAGRRRNDSKVPAQCVDRSRDLLAGVGGSNWASIAFTRSFPLSVGLALQLLRPISLWLRLRLPSV